MTECVKVVVRCRPLNSKEVESGYRNIVHMEQHDNSVSVENLKYPKDPPHVFSYDRVYPTNSNQCQIFEETARPICEAVFEGFNGTIFAYGQTGTGKTFTMEGDISDTEYMGIIPRTFHYIFDRMNTLSEKMNILVRVSYLEIYNNSIRDLLGKDQTKTLELHQNKDREIFVKDLTTLFVSSADEMFRAMKHGAKKRKTAQTEMNEDSSRSHAVFTIAVEIGEVGPDGEEHIRAGKLNLVDLAGSERQDKTKAEGQQALEGRQINLSLSALGNVIHELTKKKPGHVPYRDSVLTLLLKDSLGGNTKTVMIANTGPAEWNYDETINTLKYASRAKMIKNKPKVNEDPKDAMLRELQMQIEKLQDELSKRNSGTAMTPETIQQITVNGISIDEVNTLREKSEEEKMRLLKEKGLAEEERERAIQQIRDMEERVKQEQMERLALSDQLNQMGAMVQHGKLMEDVVRERELELMRAQEELENRRREEERLRLEMEEQEMERLAIKDSYVSLQEEVESLRAKLDKAIGKYRQKKTELQELSDEFESERTDYLDTIRQKDAELARSHFIIEYFIPEDELKRIIDRMEYDDLQAQWKLQPLELIQRMVPRPQSSWGHGNRRPTSQYAKRNAQFHDDLRFRSEDLLHLEKDMHVQSTQNYYGSSSSLCERAFGLPGNFVFDLPSDPEFARPKTSRKKSQKSSASSSSQNFPSARGLVSSEKHFM